MEENWLNQPLYANVKSDEKHNLIPKGSWKKCSSCGYQVPVNRLIENSYLCPNCGNHFNMPFAERIASFVDENSFKELPITYKIKDPLKFLAGKEENYLEKIKSAKKKTAFEESVVVGSAKLNKKKINLGIMIFEFIGGSMGVVCGDKIYQIMLDSVKKKCPLILFCTSGGARMQEGLLSLMQMAKTASGVEIMRRNKIPFITILTNPTYGGVSASFASLGDIIISEPKVKFGFAGARVIEATVKQKLPEGFQTAEFLQEKGFVDIICHRNELKNLVFQLINIIDNKK